MRGLLGIALQLVLGLLAFASTVIPTESSYNDVASQLSDLYASNGTRHTNNWAVLVCASRYWFNYRVSALGVLTSIPLSYLNNSSSDPLVKS